MTARTNNDSPAEPLLTIDHYSLSYHAQQRQIVVLDDIDLAIARGEVLGLVGESGSGKSSLAYAILRGLPGRIAHESGRIRFAGADLTAMTEAQLQGLRGDRIAMVFQNAATALNPTQTLGEHIVEVLQRHRQLPPGAARRRAVELLQQVSLADPEVLATRFAHEVSGGEKQRVVLACALACNPDLILFDEPTSALDTTTAAALLDQFRELQARTGVAALFISHDLGVIATIAQRVAVIYAGRIVEINTTAALFAAPRHPYTRMLLASVPQLSRPGSAPGLRPSAAVRSVDARPACVFKTRCAWATGRCHSDAVHLAPAGAGAQVACHHWRTIPCGALPAAAPVDAKRSGPVEPVVEAQAITVNFTQRSFFGALFGRPRTTVHAVNNVSFSLAAGETLGLVGESGCGKSSLARVLVGLGPLSGRLTVAGLHADRQTPVNAALREKIQIIFQNPDASLNPRHRVGLLLDRPLTLYRPDLDGAARRRQAAVLLERVQLSAEYAQRFPHELSGGEKQRVAIARAIAARPAVIICDEVTSGLDVSVQAAIVALLREIQRESQVALIFITHDLHVLASIAHRVAVMYLGEIIEQRPVASLRSPPYHPYTEALLGAATSVDPAVHIRRVHLHGNPPTRTLATRGCPFASRCQHRIDARCTTQRPPTRRIGAQHHIVCHLDEPTLHAIAPVWQATAAEENTFD